MSTSTNTNLTTEDYIFRTADGKLYVKYLEFNEEIHLNIKPEIIGIIQTPGEKPWGVTIVTAAGIQRVKTGVTERIESAGFKFKTLKEATDVLGYVTYWLYALDTFKALDKIKETNDNGNSE